MSMQDNIIKKLQQATCDKIELNRRILRWRKCLKEAEKALKDGCRKEHDHKDDHKRDHGKDHDKGHKDHNKC